VCCQSFSTRGQSKLRFVPSTWCVQKKPEYLPSTRGVCTLNLLPGVTVGPDSSTTVTGLWSGTTGFYLALYSIPWLDQPQVPPSCLQPSLLPRLVTSWAHNLPNPAQHWGGLILLLAQDFCNQPEVMWTRIEPWLASTGAGAVPEVPCAGRLGMEAVRIYSGLGFTNPQVSSMANLMLIILSYTQRVRSCAKPCCLRLGYCKAVPWPPKLH
jgi:hypothetical protein